MKSTIIFRQLFDLESFSYSYLLADPNSKEGLLIDPVKEQIERDLALIEELGIKLKYVLDTHIHADHITGSGLIRERIQSVQTVLSEGSHVHCANRLLSDGDELSCGSLKLKALATPGHTAGCMSYYIDGMVFTGDTLLIRGCGRTDFQQGSPEQLYNSVRQKLFTLPDSTLVYPAHNYNGLTVSSIGEEKQWNPRLAMVKTKQEFIDIMNNLDLPMPKKIDVAVPANTQCGTTPD